MNQPRTVGPPCTAFSPVSVFQFQVYLEVCVCGKPHSNQSINQRIFLSSSSLSPAFERGCSDLDPKLLFGHRR